MEADYWPGLANEAAYMHDLLARRPNRLDTDLLIVAVGRIEKLLNPNRWPFADLRRQHCGGDSELCRGWMKIREAVDFIIVALDLKPCCEGRGQSWNVSSEGELPTLPTPIPAAWIEALANGQHIIRRKLTSSADGKEQRYYCMAAQVASQVDGKWVDTTLGPESFLAPMIDAAVKVEQALKVFVLSGSALVPDCPPDSVDYDLSWLGFHEKAKSLQRTIEKTYRLVGRTRRHEKPKLLSVHEVNIGNIGIEQNIAAHRMYDCVSRFIVGFRCGIPSEEVGHFVHCLGVLRDGLRTPLTDLKLGAAVPTKRRRAPKCPTCGKQTRIRTSGKRGSRFRHWKCDHCGETGKQARVTDSAL